MLQTREQKRGRISFLFLVLGLLLLVDKSWAASKSISSKVISSTNAVVHTNSNDKNSRNRPATRGHRHYYTIPAMLQDLSILDECQGQIPLLSPTNWKRDGSYTKSWTKKDWEHHQVNSFQRYSRHLIKWIISPTARSVLPAVAMFLGWSVLVVHVMQQYPHLTKKASFLSGLSSFTAPLSLLLALKTNRALNRLLEARSMWGKMISNTKSLAQLVTIYVWNKDSDRAILMGRYLSLYLWFMKGYFRQEDATPIITTLLPPEEAAWLLNLPSDMPLPTATVWRLRQLMAGGLIEKLPRTASHAMEDRLWHLESIFGTLKRIMGSPIPPTYTRHTSRVLCLFLGLLPVALMGNKTEPTTIYIMVSLLAYIFVGIDEIGVEIEHPFPLIPMFYLARAAQTNVQNQYRALQLQQSRRL